MGFINFIKRLTGFEKREEKKRIKILKEKTCKELESVFDMLKKEDINNAEMLLQQIAPTLSEIEDDAIHADFKRCKSEIVSLKEKLLQRKRERQERERKEREAREERRRLGEQRERERQERERKEREAREEQRRLREQRTSRLKAKVTCRKRDADKILSYLEDEGVECFYHFTSVENLSSIKEHGGLYSWYYCEKHGISITDAGGDDLSRDLDRRHGLEDYVRLSFCRDHPMAHRKKQAGATLVVLEIKIDVAAFKETCFSDINAAANACRHGTSFKDLKRVDIPATKKTHVSRDDPDFKKHQAECMVKTFLPIEYITNFDELIQNDEDIFDDDDNYEDIFDEEEEVQPKRRRRRR